MLQYLTEQMNELLSEQGVITDVVLHSKRSLIEDEETREISLTFMEQEKEGKSTTATIHLFLLPDDSSCEVEVEIECAITPAEEEMIRVWRQAKEVIPEISLTEKKRYLEVGKQADTSMMLDYHFIVEMPESEEAEEELHATLQRFATDLGKLIRLAR
jgi:hypothetical protein